jgi:hypothetical protein
MIGLTTTFASHSLVERDSWSGLDGNFPTSRFWRYERHIENQWNFILLPCHDLVNRYPLFLGETFENIEKRLDPLSPAARSCDLGIPPLKPHARQTDG